MEVSRAVGEADDLPARATDVQDLITLLLHAAVQAGDTVERLDRFTALCPASDVASAKDLAQARQLMNGARTKLIRYADDLAADRPAW